MNRKSGAALIPVIMVLGLLALMITSLSLYVSNRATSLALAEDRIDETALVQSGLEFGMGRVLSTPKGFAVFGEDRIKLKIGEAKISWRAESGRLDINFADAKSLTALFSHSGLSERQANELAALIVFKRTIDAKSDIPPAFKKLANQIRGPFADLSELLSLPGMTPQTFDTIAPLITIYGASGGIDPRVADRLLLEALPDISAPMIAELMSSREKADEELTQQLKSFGELGSLFDLRRHGATRFIIETQNRAKILHRYDIVTIHYADDTEPYRVLSFTDITDRKLRSGL